MSDNNEYLTRLSGGNGGSASSSVHTCSTMSSSSYPTPLSSTINQNSINQSNNINNNNDDNITFSRLVTFYVQESAQFSISKTIQLLLEVDHRYNEIREEISVRILDPNDPFFIYLYLIDFDEYKRIKQSQNLLVSFEKFSNKLIYMFEKCSINTPKSGSATSTQTSGILHSESSDSSNFILTIRNLCRSQLTMDIVELNEFKNIIHLSFDIPSASEEFIRSNYCSIYRKSKQEIESLQLRLSTLDDQLSSLTIMKAKEIQNLKYEFDTEKGLLENKLKDLECKLQQEKIRNNESENNLKMKYLKLQNDFENIEQTLSLERKDFEIRSKELKDKFNDEITRRNMKLKELDDRNQQLNAECRVLKLEKEQTDKLASDQQAKIESISRDLSKANEIIRKLQNEIQLCQNKINTLNDVAEKQEQIVHVKESTIERLSLDLKLCLQQLKMKEKEIDRLTNDFDRQKCYCSQLELQLKSSKNVMANMNRELERLRRKSSSSSQLLTGENCLRNLQNLKLNDDRIDDHLNDDDDHDDDNQTRNPRNDHVCNGDNRSIKQSKQPPHQHPTMIRSKTSENLAAAATTNCHHLDRSNEFESNQRHRNQFLFKNSTRELPLKSVNLRTTSSTATATANRNQTNVMSSSSNNKDSSMRRSII